MRILITSAQSSLGRVLVDELAGTGDDLRLLESEAFDPPAGCESVAADHLDAASLEPAVAGIDAVVHTGELPLTPPPGDGGRLDWYTRGTYDLMAAAVAAGALRFVYCGTLDLFDRYPGDVYISELHEPFPPTSGRTMWRYLAELTVREFTRDHAITGTSLRLGTLTFEEEADAAAPDPCWLDPRDAARAVRTALGRDSGGELNWARRWQVRHVCADPPNPRFLIDDAIRKGFEHDFASAWKGGCP